MLALAAIVSTPLLLRAQDAPPPPPDGSAPPDAGGDADSGASFQQFYDQLGSQGQWIQTPDYGYAFQPNVSDPNWAPYTDGHWVYSDVGWTWVSDEPWGWATYHYGRWANIDGTGWVWIPGYEWAPAWVSWRYGGGYCGWAPLPPETFVGVDFADPGVDIGIGFHFGGDCDVSFGIGAGCYNFIPVGYIGDPYYRGRYIDRSRNFIIINNTRNITNINVNRGARDRFRGVTVGGPNLAEINQQAHTRVETVHFAEAGRPGRSTLSGNTLNVYAPRVNPATLHTARPTRVGETLSNVRLNRGASVTEPLAVNSHLRPGAPSAEAIHAAEQAQAAAPAASHIATARTAPSTTLSRPLTSMETPAQVHQAQAANNRTLNQDHAQAEKHDRVQKAEADKTANQDHAQADKDYRVQKTEADKTANQDHAQAEKEARDTAGEERATKLKQEEATHQQTEQAAAQAREERAAALQKEHAAAVEQRSTERAPQEQPRVAPQPPQRVAPAPQQRVAPAPQQRAAPAAAGDKRADKNN